MMGHELHRSGSVWSFLLSIDKVSGGEQFSRLCSSGRVSN